MSTLRSLRLLGAVEAGTVNGLQLQTYLTDAGRASEFSVLLASRGQSRRMAASSLTMAAIVGSSVATNIVFKAATTVTSAACQAVVTSSVAMTAAANSLPSLVVLGTNPVAWSLFSGSIYFEPNIRTIIANYAGVPPANYPTVDALIADSVSMADIASTPFAMSAVVASPNTTGIMALNSAGMALVSQNPVAIDIVAAKTAIMPIIANSAAAMTEIVSRSAATARMASYPGSISAISKVPAAWAAYLAGPFFNTNLALALANLIGVNPANYPTLSAMIADASALSLVAKNPQAVAALASSSSALNTLAVSPNIGLILSSAPAMAVIGPNTAAMSSFLNAPGAWPGLFASSVAKGYIVVSTALIDAIAANAALISYLKAGSTTTAASGIPDGNATSLQPFVGVPAKLLTLSAKEVGIAATYSSYNFGGSLIAGSQAGATLSLTSTANLPHVAGYSGMSWNLQAIGVTAATLPIITFFDMT